VLVLARKPNQSIMVGDQIEIKIIEIKGDQVKIGIEAPKAIGVHRKEIYEEIKEANIKASSTNQQAIDKIKKVGVQLKRSNKAPLNENDLQQ
jgi:carbon storage regulator